MKEDLGQPMEPWNDEKDRNGYIGVIFMRV